MVRKVTAGRGYELVAVDVDGFALDPDYRPSLMARVTDAATRTRRGRVVGLDGWTEGRPELHCSALWIEWADTGEREHLTDLSGLLCCNGRRAGANEHSAVPAWDAVYRERKAARAALLDQAPAAGEAGPGPIARQAWREAAPFRVTREEWSPDFDAYAAGQLGAHQVRCVLCTAAPCACRSCPSCGWTTPPGQDCPRGCVTEAGA